jgi:hypothetical protein
VYHKRTPENCPLSKFQIQENFLEFFQASARCSVPVTLDEEADPSEHTVGAYVATLVELARRLPLNVITTGKSAHGPSNTDSIDTSSKSTGATPKSDEGALSVSVRAEQSRAASSTALRPRKSHTPKQRTRPTLINPRPNSLDLDSDEDDDDHGETHQTYTHGQTDAATALDNNAASHSGLNASSLQAMHIHHAASLRILQQLDSAAECSQDEQTVKVTHGDDADDTESEVVSEITFSGVELLTLNLLFMLIDWDGDGKISAKELVMWSRDDVHPLSHTTATECISALDADADGFVGLDDFISFAAQLKEIYEIQLEAKYGIGR